MTFVLSPRRIVYEDTDLLVVDKPAGLVAHATVDPTRDHLVAAVSRYLRTRDGEAGHLTLVHRLDRDTSGLTVFTRAAELDGVLGSAFAERAVSKTYGAIVRQQPTQPFPTGTTELHSYLAPGKGPGGRTVAVRAGGRASRTCVQPLLWEGELVLVQAQPHTGRAHQIRVHLADLGFPILGDTLYGVGEPNIKRMLLHARALSLAHPRTDEPLTLTAKWPRAFLTRVPQLRSVR